MDRIDISPKAKKHLVQLLAANRKTLEDISLFVENMSLALDVDTAAFCFDTDAMAFVRLLPTVMLPDAEVLRLDEASEASPQEESPVCGAV